jgi:ribose 5-phosphate isomerase RpiB
VKVYLAAENKELGIRLANIINRGSGTCIISDMESSDYKALLKDIRNSMEDFDLSILISGSPQEASMDANRIGGVRAVVCKDLEDVSEAISAKANLIVLDSEKLSRIDGRAMVEIFKNGFGVRESQPQKTTYTPQPQAYKQAPVQQPQKKPQQSQAVQQDILSTGSNVIGGLKGILSMGKSGGKETAAAKPSIKKPEIKVKQSQDDRQKQQKKKGGLFGSLKDTFGVE